VVYFPKFMGAGGMYNLQCDHTSMLKSGCPRHVLQLESSELQVA